MQNNRLMRLTKDLNAQHYTLCNLTAADMKYIEETLINMDASRLRRKA